MLDHARHEPRPDDAGHGQDTDSKLQGHFIVHAKTCGVHVLSPGHGTLRIKCS